MKARHQSDHLQPRSREMPHSLLPKQASLVVIVIAAISLLGWLFGVRIFQSILPSLPTMKVNTALCFIAGGVALRLWHRQASARAAVHQRGIRLLIYLLASAIVLIALLTLIEFSFAVDLGIDRLLLSQSELDSQAGQMPPNVALAFLLVGSALLLFNLRYPNYLAAQSLTVTAWLISLLGLLGYIYRDIYFYTVGSNTGMALHTAIALLVLCSGMLLTIPDRGLMLLVTGDLAGSRMARRLLPITLVLPSFVGYFSHAGYRWNLYPEGLAIVLESFVETTVFAGLIGWNAYVLNCSDRERRQSEAASQESEDRFRSAFDFAAIGMALVSPEGRWLKVNHSLCEILGYSEAELLATTFQAITHPDDLDTDLGYVRQLLAGEIRTYEMEKRYFHKQGQVVWVLLSVSLVRNSQGQPLYFIAQIQDISDRVLAEMALRQAEEGYRNIFENATEGIFQTTPDGRFVNANFALAQIYGYDSPEDLIAHLNAQQHLYVDPQRRVEFTETMNRTDVVSGFESQVYRRDGQIIWVAESARAVRNDRGQLLYYEGVVTDITPRKEVESALRQSEERWQLALNGANDGIWDWNVQTNAVFFSRRWKEMLGFEDHEIANHLDEWGKRVHPDDLGWVTQVIQDHFDQKTPFYITEHRVQCKDGHYKWILDRGQALWDDAGNVMRMVGSHTDISDRKEAEAALQQSEERLQLALEGSGDGLWDWNVTTGEVYLSPQWFNMLGYGVGELPGHVSTWDRLIHPEDKPWVTDRLEAHLQDSSVRYAFDYRALTKSGKWKWVANYGKVVARDADGNPLRMVGTHRDVSDRKAAEAALRQAEEKYRSIFENALQGIFQSTSDGEYLSVNPAMARIYGYDSPETMIAGANKFSDSTYVDSAYETRFKSMMALYGQVRRLEYQVMRRDRGKIWVEERTRIVRDSMGQLLYYEGFITDITRRKLAEEALRESEERLRLFIEHVPSAIAMFDQNMRYLAVSQRWLQDYNLVGQDITGRSHYEIFPEVPDRWKAIHQRCLAGTVEQSQEDSFLRANGHQEWLQWEIHPWYRSTGEVGGIAMFTEVITQRKQAEQALQQLNAELVRSNQELEQFAYIASHDLREPLRKIKSYTDLLVKRYRDQLDERADKYIDYISDGALRMQTLIADLLTYSRVGRTETASTPVDLGVILQRTLQDLEATIQENQAIITADCLPIVQANPVQMGQLLQNLIANAIKFHDEAPPQIQIRAEQQNEFWQIAVQDNGIGIDPQYAERIFAIFQRLHTREEYAGTGIGLAVCKKIVERHGGQIWVESEPGQGSTFYFTLPAPLEASAVS